MAGDAIGLIVAGQDVAEPGAKRRIVLMGELGMGVRDGDGEQQYGGNAAGDRWPHQSAHDQRNQQVDRQQDQRDRQQQRADGAFRDYGVVALARGRR